MSGEYEKLLKLIQYRMFLGKGSVIFGDSIITKTALEPSLVQMRTDKIDEAIGKKKDMSVIKKNQITQLYCNDLRGILQYNYIDYVNMLMLEKLERLCKQNKVDYEKVFGQHYIPVKQIGDFDTSSEIAKWFNQSFAGVLDILEVTEGYSKKRLKTPSYILDKITVTLNWICQ